MLLCSDGIHSLVSDQELAEIAASGGSLTGLCNQLVSAAKREGGTDNCTVVIVSIKHLDADARDTPTIVEREQSPAQER